MLNDTQCKQAKAGEKPLKLSDEKGLYLLVSATGAKYWRMDYRFAGKRKTLALGVYPETPLKLARQKRDEARRLLDEGSDPSEARRAEKIARKVAADSSFEAVGREWYEKQKGGWVASYAAKVLTSLEKDLFPSLGRRPIADISAAEMLATLKKVEARGALETLKRVRQRASDIFLYAIATDRVENNPVSGLEKALKTAPVKHRPALRSTGMHEFFIRLDACSITALVKHAIRLLVFTFLRPGELRGACWEEIDLDAGIWIIPAERDRVRGLVGMKMKEAHTMLLPTQAVDVLREMRNLTDGRGLVFPNRNDPMRSISDGTINSALRAMGYAGNEVTGAGFRTTATGVLLEMGWRPEIIDRQLAHRERKEVFGAYSHQAEYLPERRKMMQQWADWLDSAKSGAKVIPLHGAAAA